MATTSWPRWPLLSASSKAVRLSVPIAWLEPDLDCSLS
jgi:hypothetical protein